MDQMFLDYLLFLEQEPAEDMKFNENDLPGYKKFMNKIWQASRFFSMYAEKISTS